MSAPKLTEAQRARLESTAKLGGHSVAVVRTVLPWGGDGWMAVLDFIRPWLRAYHETLDGAIAGARRDIDAWKSGSWRHGDAS